MKMLEVISGLVFGLIASVGFTPKTFASPQIWIIKQKTKEACFLKKIARSSLTFKAFCVCYQDLNRALKGITGPEC